MRTYQPNGCHWQCRSEGSRFAEQLTLVRLFRSCFRRQVARIVLDPEVVRPPGELLLGRGIEPYWHAYVIDDVVFDMETVRSIVQEEPIVGE